MKSHHCASSAWNISTLQARWISAGLWIWMAATCGAAQLGVLTYSSVGTSISINRRQTQATGEVVVPDEIEGLPVTCIADSAFTDCKSIAAVTLPPTMTGLGSNAFEQCIEMTTINIPPGVSRIGYGCFYACSGLLSVSLPASVTDLKGGVFQECRSLQTVNLPGNLTNIPKFAFAFCESLLDVTIPAGVQTIGESAFSGCSSLTALLIPDGVRELQTTSFKGCSALTSLVVPPSVDLIGTFAFLNCEGLTSVTIQGERLSLFNGAFNNCVALTALTKSVLESGESVALHVIFNPEAGGVRNATLRIFSNDSDRSPFTICRLRLEKGIPEAGCECLIQGDIQTHRQGIAQGEYPREKQRCGRIAVRYHAIRVKQEMRSVISIYAGLDRARLGLLLF